MVLLFPDQSASTDGFTSKGSDMETEDTSDNEFDDTVNGALMEERTPSVEASSSQQQQNSSQTVESIEKNSPDSNRQLDNTKDDVKTDRAKDFMPNYNPQINDVSCKGGTVPAKANSSTSSTTVTSHDMNHTDESIAKTAHSLLFENCDETIEDHDETIDNRDETSTDDNSDEIFEEAREFHDEEGGGKSKDADCNGECIEGIEKTRTGVMCNESDKSNVEVSEIDEATDGHGQSHSFTNVQRLGNHTDNSSDKLLTNAQCTENNPENDINDTAECSMQKGFTDDHSETSSSSVATDIRNIERPSVSGEED